MDLPVPLTGEAKTDYQRTYMRVRRNKQEIEKIARAVIPGHGGDRYFTPVQQDMVQEAAKLVARSNGIELNSTFGQVNELSKATITKLIDGVPTQVADNDARAKGIGYKLDLHERLGELPGKKVASSGGASITVNVLMLPDEAEAQVIDHARVIEST